ncbi:hypothetical protein F511_18790 [Dorcoceras hygrometricum]|uniref:TATA-binding protein-associated factor BTAF1 n=1 Tax=Dorcoceras hygrometricum TaxID=472368 RepID=A0A2Z7AKS2_9LAMI|nr:hypothetical protein F511_18790 [Dorcoceras hygrometricum]
MAQQSSRLHRLLTLLDTGSTQATRFSAARQIGEIAKSRPQDLIALLNKVSQYLHSKKWDTRVAAARAVGAIAENVKHSSLTELATCLEVKLSEAGIYATFDEVVIWPNYHSKIVAGTSFRSFDLNKVLEFGALLASGGQEYDIGNDNCKNPRERLSRQKQNLRRRLGLDVCEQFMDVNDMIRDEDLVLHKLNYPVNGIPSHYFASQPLRNIYKLVTSMVPTTRSRRPSARELNILKRKAKSNSKDQSKGWSQDGSTEATQSHDAMAPRSTSLDSPASQKDTISDDDNIENDGDGGWPFQSFVEQLLVDIFDPVWEVRHGSIMALREILTYQGACAGILLPEFSCAGSSGFDLENVRRERETDFDLQVSVDDSEPVLKRPKLEDDSSSVVESIDGDLNACPKVEGDNGAAFPMHANGETDGDGFVKGEPQSFIDSTGHCEKDVKDTIDYSEDKELVEKMTIIKKIPQNSELMNLVMESRTSWLRNCEFLQDCAIRFLCVLALDRFGDYISDQVVAPVRETCAQALGAVLKYMHPTLVQETLNVLLQMQRRPEWEIRHGSLLGTKYLVAVRQEMLHDLLGPVLPACKTGLEDPDDDVRAVAAEALLPTSAAIVSLKGPLLHSIVMLLWDILLDLDDLSPSTSRYFVDFVVFEVLAGTSACVFANAFQSLFAIF